MKKKNILKYLFIVRKDPCSCSAYKKTENTELTEPLLIIKTALSQ